MFNKAINKYLNKHHYKNISLQSVLFDMDGVLFNSMPYHADAWYKAMNARGLNMSKEEAYLHEGRTGSGTINIVYERQWNRQATKEEIEAIYNEKTVEFNKHPLAKAMPGAWEILCKIKKANIIPTVVTGSGQSSLLNRLEEKFPGMFHPELMVTAFDVKFGKPHPEPYLMALEKGKLHKNEAIVIENAPLGVEAGVGAGIFTIAVNTGPLDPQVLLNAGADLLFPSIQDLCDKWDELITSFKTKKEA